MSENEKLEQIGRAAEEYSTIKGHLNHVIAKLNKANLDYQGANQGFQNLRVEGDVVMALAPGRQAVRLDGLLNTHQLIEALNERSRLQEELRQSAERLKALAPHLL